MQPPRDDGLRRRRTFVAKALGEDATELELQAILQAEEFFGPGTKLEIGMDYSVFPRTISGPKYGAAIPVHELVPEGV